MGLRLSNRSWRSFWGGGMLLEFDLFDRNAKAMISCV